MSRLVLAWRTTPAKLAARMRSWRVTLLRGRAQQLGTVEAPAERAAEVAAVAQFQLSDEQRIKTGGEGGVRTPGGGRFSIGVALWLCLTWVNGSASFRRWLENVERLLGQPVDRGLRGMA
jgi:hypothetical protein